MVLTAEYLEDLRARVCTPASLSIFRATTRIRPEDIACASADIIRAYVSPIVGNLEASDDWDTSPLDEAVKQLTFARLLTSQVYRTEYTSAIPNKRDATTAASQAISGEACELRRLAVSVLYLIRAQFASEEQIHKTPKIIPLLGDNI